MEDLGEIPISESDDANIPVCVGLDCEGDKYSLTAANYMPRKDMVMQDAYHVVSEDRKELEEAIKVHVLPLYENAVAKLKAICDGKDGSLYYWSKP